MDSSPAPATPQLLDRARRGDPAAFRELFHLNVRQVHRIVYRLVGPNADLDEIVQNVFVQGFRSLATFRGESLFSTWLGRIATRVALRATRQRDVQLVPLEYATHVPHDTPGPERHCSDREGLAHLDEFLASLGPKRRGAFVLHVLEGYSIKEVAAMLGASVTATKVRIHDARRELERRAKKDPWFRDQLTERGRS